MPKWKLIFRWYDLWVGAFIDWPKRKLYLFPLPMVGFEIQFRRRIRCYKCNKPAVYLCVHGDGWGIKGNRDPLCQDHGVKVGPCADYPALDEKHVPIPSPWYYDESELWS